jgi:hypothetical protein
VQGIFFGIVWFNDVIKILKEDCCMNTKKMMFIVCSLMMSVIVYGMELEKSNEPFISQDRIFVWSQRDRQYHAVTELGEISEDTVLQKNDKVHKTYRAQLVIEEGKEGKKYSLKTVQKMMRDGEVTEFRSLKKGERILIPITPSQEQCDTLSYKLYGGFDNRKKAVVLIDSDNNEYFITHVYYPQKNSSKAVRVYNEKKHRTVEVPVVGKKDILLKLDTLEKEVRELKQLAAGLTTSTLAQRAQTLIDRRNRNRLLIKIIGGTSFFAVMVALYYACSSFVASTH